MQIIIVDRLLGGRQGNFFIVWQKILNYVQYSRTVSYSVVEDDVDALDIHTAAEQVGGDQDSALEVLEELVSLETLLLVHSAVNVNGGEVLLLQQGGQGNAALDGFDENDDLNIF